MKERKNFLMLQSEERLRREINNICGSYSHPWDVLAELLQNSVDAIRSHILKYGDSSHHSINIVINKQESSIAIRDSGIGIPSKEIENLLAPNGSNKSKKSDLIGEKGVGLTYVIFSSNHFFIETHSMEDSYCGEVIHALRWCSEDADLPEIEGQTGKKSSESVDTFTKIIASGIDDDVSDSIFSLSYSTLTCILRTKTAVGSTKQEPEPIKIIFTLIEKDGKERSDEIPFQYMYPQELVGEGKWLEYNEEFNAKMASFGDREKRNYLQGKGLLKTGTVKGSNREIHYSAFFVPSRKTWDQINQKNEFFVVSEEGNNQNFYTPAIEIATKGMPTAVTLDPPLTGTSGYWPNIHILMQDDSLPFDIGRKSIPSRTKGLLRKISHDIFKDVTRFAQYMHIDPPISANPTLSRYKKEERFKELKNLPDLHIKDIPYVKQPDSQECAVVALFHELTATNILKGYRTLKTGYKETYDLWGYYEVRDDNVGDKVKGDLEIGTKLPIIIEFKYELSSILSDFENDIKRFSDIDLLVCWSIDEAKFAANRIQIEVVPEEKTLFSGTNYCLFLPGIGSDGQKSIISLQRYTEDLSRNRL